MFHPSINLIAAGASGFFTLIRSGEPRPDTALLPHHRFRDLEPGLLCFAMSSLPWFVVLCAI